MSDKEYNELMSWLRAAPEGWEGINTARLERSSNERWEEIAHHKANAARWRDRALKAESELGDAHQDALVNRDTANRLQQELDVKASVSFVPLSTPQQGFGDPCPSCGQNLRRLGYPLAEVNGVRKAVVLETCTCGMQS